ncbi:MAG: 50S ribosomal protein L11 methyltransferase [Gammaproteobacteria bacterium]|nr:MAG: 50S ribosomal protein L11 methyltransferase [Gammaproteobacteria bacterium]
MSWLKITFAVKKDQLNFVTERLEFAGAQSVTIEDAGDHPLFDLLDGELPVWKNSLATGLFPAEQGLDAIIAGLTENFAPEKLPECRVESLPDQDWERCWMDRFQPIQYGSDLWVCPTWHNVPDTDATNVMLDPGLAFGSGSHETTRLCMKWLAKQQVSGKKVIDFGCGSGILAIASLKLGAVSALGVDIDPQALFASSSNAEINNVSEKLKLVLPGQQPENSSGDIVFANILAGTLIDLKSHLLEMRAPQGVLVLSGILSEQETLIVNAFEPGNILQVEKDGDWLLITVKEKPSNSNIIGTMQ